MDLILLTALAALATVGLVQTFLMGLQTWEHRRFARSRLARLDRCRPEGLAMVFVPCKGVDLGLEKNLRQLFQQDYDDYEITFVVESPWDPAYNLIAQVMAEHPRRVAHLVVAGHAEEGGQKVHNLRMAIQKKLRSDIEYLVFADSDARPRPEWLRAMISRLTRNAKKRTGATTGYRWLIPARPTLANHLLYSINSGVATLLGSRDNYPIWGGSWAIRRETFEETKLLEAWRGTLSDDLVATNVLRRHGWEIRYEPACMIASPTDGSLWSHFAFLRRQYLISRCCLFRLWAGGLLGSGILSICWLYAIGLLAWSATTGSWLVYPTAAACAALYGVNLARASIRQGLLRVYLPEHEKRVRLSIWFDLWLSPLAGWFNTLAMLVSSVGRDIHWRGITYRLRRNGTTQIIKRAPSPVIEAATTPTPSSIDWPALSDEKIAEKPRRQAA
jgi:hypothetical protein